MLQDSDVCNSRDRLEDDIDSLSSRDVNYERLRRRYNDRLLKLYNQIDSIETEISDIQLKLDGIKRKDITPEKALKCLKKFDLLYEEMTREEQRKLIELILNRIHFNDDGTIKNLQFKFPITNETDPRNKNQQYMDIEYEVHNDTVFLKQHELIVIPNKTSRPTHRLIRSHSYTRKLATYKQIQEYVLTKYNLNVSSEYIAIVKRKHGIDMQAVRLKENAKHNNPPQEKIEAIEDALKYFKIR